jgi:hypothetical protein
MTLKRILLICVTTFQFVTSTAQAVTDSDNVTTNGSFETNASRWQAGNNLEGWSIDKQDTLAPDEFVLDPAVRHSGNASARFTNSTHGLTQRVQVKPGEFYNLRFWTKTNLTSGGFGLHIAWTDAQGKWIFNDKGQQITHGSNQYGISDWREVRVDNLRAPDTATAAMISTIALIEIDHASVEGDYWIDDISMKPSPADRSGKEYRSSARISPAAVPPAINGELDDTAWRTATEISGFTVPDRKIWAQPQTTIAATYDAEALYFAITAQDPDASAYIANNKKHDADFSESDSFEILLSPADSGITQFRLALNKEGIRADFRDKWNKKKGESASDAAWNPEWQAAVHQGEHSWTAEVRIPFTSLGKSAPRPGETWDINVLRHYPASEDKLSSWSPLNAQVLMHDPGSFGELIFDSSELNARDAAFSPNEVSVELVNQNSKPQKALVRINREDGGTNWQLFSEKVELAAGERRQVMLPTPHDGQSSFSWLTVEVDGEVILRQGCIPRKEFAAVDWNDPLNILGQKLYVATDLRTFKPIQTNHNFDGGIAGPQLIERSQRAVDLIVELPEGVRATHVVQFINNWRWWNPVEPAEVRTISDGDRTYSQFRFELPCIFNNGENGSNIFFETDLPEGTRANGKCYLQWDTGRQPSHPLDIEVITVGRTPPFKKLFNGIYYAEAEMLLTWLPDVGTVYPTLGLNRLEIDPNPEAGGSQGGLNKGPSRRKWFDELVKQARAGGLYMATSPSQSTPWAANWMSVDPSARALDYQGNELKEGENYSLCVLYRGPKYQEYIDKFVKGPAFNEYGLSWLAVDLELWSDEIWNKGCFCDRCLQAYPQYMAAHHPNQAAGDPKTFMAHPDVNSEQAAFWKEFRAWSKREFIGSIWTMINECVSKHGMTSGPRPGLLVSEWLFPTPPLFDVVDYFEINCYRKPVEVARRLGEYGINVSQGRKNIAAAQGLGQTHGLDAMLTTQDMTHSIYEAAAAGVQGMVWYDITSLDALKLKTLVDGFRTIQPFEDIILDGVCTATIPTAPDPASTRQIRLGNEALLIVRNYGGAASTVAVVTLPESLADDSVVRDVQTNQPLDVSGKSRNVIKVPLEPEQARLLYFGSDQNLQKRFAN